MELFWQDERAQINDTLIKVFTLLGMLSVPVETCIFFWGVQKQLFFLFLTLYHNQMSYLALGPLIIFELENALKGDHDESSCTFCLPCDPRVSNQRLFFFCIYWLQKFIPFFLMITLCLCSCCFWLGTFLGKHANTVKSHLSKISLAVPTLSSIFDTCASNYLHYYSNLLSITFFSHKH